MLKTSEQTLEALQFLRPRYLGPGGDAQALRIIDAAIKQIKHLDELYSGHAETLQKMTAILKKINDAGREGVSDENGNQFINFTDDNLHLYEGEFNSDKDAVDHFLKLHGTQLRLVYYTACTGFNLVGDFRTPFRRFR